jgi:hypothetical protein
VPGVLNWTKQWPGNSKGPPGHPAYSQPDIPIARTIKMKKSLIIGTLTLVQVPECNIGGRNCSRMEVKDNVIWLDMARLPLLQRGGRPPS